MPNTQRPIIPLAFSAQPLIDAIAEYDRTAPERNTMWEGASCTLDVIAAEDADRAALIKVQDAFYDVTKDRNRQEPMITNCSIATLSPVTGAGTKI